VTLGNDNGTDVRTDRQTDRRTDRVRRNMRPPPRETALHVSKSRVMRAIAKSASRDATQSLSAWC